MVGSDDRAMGNLPESKKARQERAAAAEARRAREAAYFELAVEEVAGPQIPCPWHFHEVDHPTGAPPCRVNPEALDERMISMGQLIFWLTMMATEIAKGHGMVLEHLTRALNTSAEAKTIAEKTRKDLGI